MVHSVNGNLKNQLLCVMKASPNISTGDNRVASACFRRSGFAPIFASVRKATRKQEGQHTLECLEASTTSVQTASRIIRGRGHLAHPNPGATRRVEFTIVEVNSTIRRCLTRDSHVDAMFTHHGVRQPREQSYRHAPSPASPA